MTLKAFTSPRLTRRCGRPGPDQQHRSAGEPVGLRGSPTPAMRDFGPGHRIGGVECMVRNDNAGHILPAMCQALHSGFDLRPIDAPILEGRRGERT